MQSFWQVTGYRKRFFHRRHTRHVSYTGNHIILWIHSELFHLMSSLNTAEVKVTDTITVKCCDHLVFGALCYTSRWSLCIFKWPGVHITKATFTVQWGVHCNDPRSSKFWKTSWHINPLSLDFWVKTDKCYSLRFLFLSHFLHGSL